MKITLDCIGRVGSDAEKIQSKTENWFVTFPLAVTETWKNKTGERQERVTWVKCQKTVKENSKLNEFLKKGTLVSLVGAPSVRAYMKKNGEAGAEMVVNFRDLVFLSMPTQQTEPSNQEQTDTGLAF